MAAGVEIDMVLVLLMRHLERQMSGRRLPPARGWLAGRLLHQRQQAAGAHPPASMKKRRERQALSSKVPIMKTAAAGRGARGTQEG